MQKINRRTILTTAPVVALCGCTSMPSGYTKVASKLLGITTESLNSEVKSSYAQVINEANDAKKLDRNSPTAKRVHMIFANMVPFAEKENKTGVKFDWQIEVIESEDLNAWAMPGGKMAFYTGIVDKLKLTNAEIAAIMGHEMTHAIREHGKQKIVQQQTTGIATSLLLNSVSITNNAGLDQAIVGLAKNFALDMPFSRANESEADAGGIMLMAQTGYDPRAAVNVWKKMTAFTGSSGTTLESFTSTHPTNKNRISELTKLTPKALQYYEQSKTKHS